MSLPGVQPVHPFLAVLTWPVLCGFRDFRDFRSFLRLYPAHPVHPCLLFCVVEVALPFWFCRFRIDPYCEGGRDALYRRHSSGGRDGFVEAAI